MTGYLKFEHSGQMFTYAIKDYTKEMFMEIKPEYKIRIKNLGILRVIRLDLSYEGDLLDTVRIYCKCFPYEKFRTKHKLGNRPYTDNMPLLLK